MIRKIVKIAFVLTVSFTKMGHAEDLQENIPFRAYADGIFDMFHEGHVSFLYRAKVKAEEMAGKRPVHLLVGITVDEGVADYKRATILTFQERCEAVNAHPLVENIIAGTPMVIEEDFIVAHDLDLVIHGDDFTKEKALKYYPGAVKTGIFVMIPYTEGISTTKILREAKLEGKITMTANLTLIPIDELIDRIRDRSWEELKISN